MRGEDEPRDASELPVVVSRSGPWAWVPCAVVLGIYLALVLRGDPVAMMTRVSAPGSALLFGLACVALASLGFWSMVGALALTADRMAAAAPLVAGVGYALANAAAFLWILSTDRFGLFEPGYVGAVVRWGPGGFLTVALLVGARSRRVPGVGLMGLGFWVAGVGLAHLWAVGVASASV